MTEAELLYWETTHEKADVVGGVVKHKAVMAVVKKSELSAVPEIHTGKSKWSVKIMRNSSTL